jgi:predicted methyltransferase
MKITNLMALTLLAVLNVAPGRADVPVAPSVAAAVADSRRPAEQFRQDALRKPASLIAFAGLKAGDLVADFMPGNAYFTRIMSGVVGPAGRVYAFLPTEQLENCSPSEVAGTRLIEHDKSYANVSVLSGPAAKFLVPQKLDVIWTAQNYHDLHDSFMGPVDVASLNRAFFNSLKPGGILLVIDHVAEPGSGVRDTETLHRIDPDRLKQEVEAAGFVLDAQSDLLRSQADDHRRSVFDGSVRGRTDQMVLRFRKP